MRGAALCWIGLFWAVAAWGQYPAKPVKVVIGYAAGSSTDIVGRVMVDRLAAYWKQAVYVETKAGAAGNLAADAVAKAPGDGYTLLFAQNGLAISAAALPNLPYRAETDLVPLAPVAATPHILVAEAGLPDYEATLWQGFFAPASLPAELGAKIAADIQAVLAQPETREKMQGASVVLWEDSQAGFKKAFLADVEKWRALVKKTGLKLQ